jgi:CBS domain-containing protein
MTVEDIMKVPDLWARDPVPPVHESCTTFNALELMVRNGLHRVVTIKPPHNKLTGILTQSMLISFLRQHKRELGHLKDKPVSEMIVGLPQCLTVTESSTAINAFNTMSNNDVSGLAIVDEEQTLVGCVSISDLRTVGTNGEFFHRLFRPISEFKTTGRQEHVSIASRTHFVRGARKTVPRNGLFVTPEDTFQDVLNKFADGNIHRVFVCASTTKPKPICAITQGDFLRIVMDDIISTVQTTG